MDAMKYNEFASILSFQNFLNPMNLNESSSIDSDSIHRPTSYPIQYTVVHLIRDSIHLLFKLQRNRFMMLLPVTLVILLLLRSISMKFNCVSDRHSMFNYGRIEIELIHFDEV